MSEPAYLQLDPDVEHAIAENLRSGRMHPHSFPDEQVLRREATPTMRPRWRALRSRAISTKS